MIKDEIIGLKKKYKFEYIQTFELSDVTGIAYKGLLNDNQIIFSSLNVKENLRIGYIYIYEKKNNNLVLVDYISDFIWEDLQAEIGVIGPSFTYVENINAILYPNIVNKNQIELCLYNLINKKTSVWKVLESDKYKQISTIGSINDYIFILDVKLSLFTLFDVKGKLIQKYNFSKDFIYPFSSHPTGINEVTVLFWQAFGEKIYGHYHEKMKLNKSCIAKYNYKINSFTPSYKDININSGFCDIRKIKDSVFLVIGDKLIKTTADGDIIFGMKISDIIKKSNESKQINPFKLARYALLNDKQNLYILDAEDNKNKLLHFKI